MDMTMTEQTKETAPLLSRERFEQLGVQLLGDLDACDGCPMPSRSVEPVTITEPPEIAGVTVWLCRPCRELHTETGFSG